MVLIGKINSAVSAIPAIGFLLTKLNSSAIITLVLLSWGRSSAGRAFDWQSRGHGFDPHRLHHIKNRLFMRIGGFSLTFCNALEMLACGGLVSCPLFVLYWTAILSQAKA